MLRPDWYGGSGQTIGLNPGEEQQVDQPLDIARIYDVSRPGTYLVRVMRNAILGDMDEIKQRARAPSQEVPNTWEKAVSNVLQFTITPP